jgi:predicted dinucleotide-binding enzyme
VVLWDASGYAAPPVMFVAGDDAARKPAVLALVRDLGFDAVDAGPLRLARLLEPHAMLWIHMAINQRAPRDNAFAFLRRDRERAGASR